MEEGVKDFVTTVLGLSNKNPDDGGGGQNCLNLRDVIYGRPPI